MPRYVRGSRLSADDLRRARQQAQQPAPKQEMQRQHAQPIRPLHAARPRPQVTTRPRGEVAKRPRRAPVPVRRRRRWTPLRVALVGVPLAIVALVGALVLQTALRARTAYEQIFVTPQAPIVVTVGPSGTPFIVQNATRPPDPPPSWDKGRINLLLLGADTNTARRDAGEIPLSDTIIIVSIDPVSKQIGMMSIPRDLLVAIPGVGNDKINAAYSNGELSGVTGPGLVRATVEYNFGIKINYFAQVDFEGFQKIVDTMGGVTMDVTAPIKDDEYPGEQFNYTRVVFHTGLQHMDGKTALRYVRTRHDDNDFARGNRQQQLLEALREQGVSLGLITKAPQLISQLGDTVRTDLPPGDALKLARLMTEIKSDQIHSYNLLSATTEQWSPGQPYYLIPDWDKIHEMVNQMAPVSSTPEASAPAVEKPNLRARVQLVNGTHVNKLAARSAAKLQQAGFLSVATAQAPDAGQHPHSVIVSYSNDQATARLVAQLLGLPTSEITTGDPAQSGGLDLVVILGDDAAANSS